MKAQSSNIRIKGQENPRNCILPAVNNFQCVKVKYCHVGTASWLISQKGQCHSMGGMLNS